MHSGLSTDRWKRTLNDYVFAAAKLAYSVLDNGVRIAIPVDPNGELLDGSHRVACAIACGIESVPVTRETQFVWAPPWDRNWFVMHGAEDLSRVMADWEAIKK